MMGLRRCLCNRVGNAMKKVEDERKEGLLKVDLSRRPSRHHRYSHRGAAVCLNASAAANVAAGQRCPIQSYYLCVAHYETKLTKSLSTKIKN